MPRGFIRHGHYMEKDKRAEEDPKMKKSSVILIVVSVFVLYFICNIRNRAFSQAEYKDDDAEARAYNTSRSVKTVQNLNFRVEDDRPIVKVAGVYRPIDLDSYIALKFNMLDKKMNENDAALGKRIDELSARVDVLEKKLSALLAYKKPAPLDQSATQNQSSTQNQSATTP